MCGIVGAAVFDASNYRITEDYLVKMRDTMVHRGPDGAGVWVSGDGKTGLGHRRLSIIDLSEAAAQPMANEDASVWVSFNGEIYNHREIRQELEKRGGHTWRTDHSDTEVILHAYEEWGIEFLEKLRGMFAIALWDGRRKELYLIRDRIGIKPLYYSVHNGRIVFASEIKALLQDPDQKKKVSHEAFYHYLSFLTTPAPQTLFDGIKKLPGGCFARVSTNGNVEIRKYWEVLENTEDLTGVSDEELSQRVIAELREAVRLRKVSDVPVGVFLSGGIDSSTNAALFSENDTQPVKTFSIGYQGEYDSYQNELHYARQMADFAGAEYHEKLLTVNDLLEFLPKMVRLQDEPIADPVCVPVYYVSKLARDNGVIVCQVGEGADELFWGYPAWKTALKLQNAADIPMTGWLKKLGMYALATMGRDRGFRYEWLRRSALGQPVFWSGAEAFTEVQKQRLLHPVLRQELDGLTSWQAIEPLRNRFEELARDRSHLNWMSYTDLNLRLPELLLMRVDKMSMGVSLEGRVPFLDHKFVEFAMSIPAKRKTADGVLKSVLKSAVRGIIPDNLIDRRKQGFGVPIYEWFFQELGDRTKSILEKFCDETEFFDKQEVARQIESGNGPQVWYMLNFAMWWNEYIS